MKKENLNFVIDAVALVIFILLVSTGLLMSYVLPPGSGHFSELWGMDRHEWGQLHFWIAIVLIIVIAIHLFLHWKWIFHIVKGRQREKVGIRVALLVAGLIILGIVAVLPFFGKVEQTEKTPHKMRSSEHVESYDYNIDGSMTLTEVEKLTGVKGSTILRELSLPGNLPMDENLGRLQKEYGFELKEVRDVVQKQLNSK